MIPAPPHSQLIITHGQLEFLEWLAEQPNFSDRKSLLKICRDIRAVNTSHTTTPSERDVLGDIAQYIQKHSWISSPGHITVISKDPLIKFLQSLRNKQTGVSP